MTITESIGKKVRHGSHGYQNEETIKQISFLKDSVEIEFESGVFSTMSPGEFGHFMRYEELSYKEKHHEGSSYIFSYIFFCDTKDQWYSLID